MYQHIIPICIETFYLPGQVGSEGNSQHLRCWDMMVFGRERNNGGVDINCMKLPGGRRLKQHSLGVIRSCQNAWTDTTQYHDHRQLHLFSHRTDHSIKTEPTMYPV
jgi:hypothetical protein